MGTTYRLRDPEYVDLAGGGNHWRLQPRDGEGKWTESGGVAKRAVKGVVKASRVTASHRPSMTEREYSAESANVKTVGRVAPAHTQNTALAKTNLSLTTGKNKKAVKSQIKVWSMSPGERAQVLADLNDDPLPDTTDEDLFHHLHGADKQMRAKALLSLEARKRRYEFLAETAHNGLLTVKTREAFGKWDSRVAKVPGGKGLLAMRDRFLKEERLVLMKRKGHAIKEVGKEFAMHGAVGSALVALTAGAAGLLAMKYGGDAHHAEEVIHHFMTSGPKIGAIPVVEIASWASIQAAIVGVGRGVSQKRFLKKLSKTA